MPLVDFLLTRIVEKMSLTKSCKGFAMRIRLSRSLLIAGAIGMLPAVATAGENKTTAKDPNRIICEKQEVVGSRLATKRVCMTAAEWADRRRDDRDAINKAQVNRAGPSGS
jgi:hypothetical protein